MQPPIVASKLDNVLKLVAGLNLYFNSWPFMNLTKKAGWHKPLTCTCSPVKYNASVTAGTLRLNPAHSSVNHIYTVKHSKPSGAVNPGMYGLWLLNGLAAVVTQRPQDGGEGAEEGGVTERKV